MVCQNICMAPPRPNGWRCCFQSLNRLSYNFLGESKWWRASKSQYLFKSYGNFSKGEGFCLMVELHGEGSGRSLQSRFISSTLPLELNLYKKILPSWLTNTGELNINIIMFSNWEWLISCLRRVAALKALAHYPIKLEPFFCFSQ